MLCLLLPASTGRCRVVRDARGQSEGERSIVADAPHLSLGIPLPAARLHASAEGVAGKGDAYSRSASDLGGDHRNVPTAPWPCRPRCARHDGGRHDGEPTAGLGRAHHNLPLQGPQAGGRLPRLAAAPPR